MKPLIVFKTVSFPTFSETFIVSNIIAAIKKGYDIKIIVDTINPKTNTSQPDLLEKYKLFDKVYKFSQPKGKIMRKVKAIFLLLNPVLFYYFFKYCDFKKRTSFDYLFILKFYWKYRKSSFHVHYGTAIQPLFELKEIGFLKSKIIVTFHGYDEHSLPEGELLKNLIYQFNKHVACITANSQYLKNNLIAKGFCEKKITIIPIGIDTEFFNCNKEKSIEKKTFKILSIGRLVEFKGHSFGIKTVKILKDKGYQIEYSILGDGTELEQLKKLVAELNLEDTVRFYGFRNQTEIKEILNENHLFLMTSTSDKTGRCETFGVVSLEAQAMGLPVIGFKSGGFPETLVEGITGITVKDKDFKALAKVIEELIEDNKKIMAISFAAKKHIKDNFDTNIVTTKYLDLYS